MTVPNRLLFPFKPETWMRKAACAGRDSSLFFPGQGDQTLPAKLVCAECPVKQECLEYAFVTNERHGIWGGTSERERRRLRQAWTAKQRLQTEVEQIREAV